MTDAKYFTTTKKGEIAELQEELDSPKEEKRKEAVKKVIAAMTVGKDVSALFINVLNCIQTSNLELKKLVYLYVINHAKLAPDRAILVVSSFQKDAMDPNPLIRALAIRTMGCIRVDKITEYLCEPLRTSLKDKDPYVRKTAATCVAKLFDINPTLCVEQGFLDQLTGLLGDSNPLVVANAVAALTEIDEASPKGVFAMNGSTAQKLMTALNDCNNEWGQVFLLNALSKYRPSDSKEAQDICDRIVSRLNHSNSAVVLGAMRVLMIMVEYLKDQDRAKEYCKKMAPPLVTLLTIKEPEIQYVALRNISLIIQKRPSILSHELRVFFIKYNDPIYVKMEKLEIMIMLASEKNIDQVLNEFKVAASEVDVEFVRKAVRAIGRCAIKIDKAAERCIQVLLDLIQTKVTYVVQEAIVVIKDIFRKYPGRYESIIATLCENLETLDEPEAKASMIWIVGEYAERIDNADELLKSFLENFHDENTQVQLQLLTGVVKLFLKKPKDNQQMVETVLNLATQESDNPDLRDRGYIYWRLLSTDPKAAKAVVLGERPLISDSSNKLDEALLKELIGNIGTLSSIYHKLPENFVTKVKEVKSKKTKKQQKDDDSSLLSNSKEETTKVGNILDDDGPSSPSQGKNDMDEIFGTNTPTLPKEVVLPAEKANGMQLAAAFSRKNNRIFFESTWTNTTSNTLTDIAVAFNKNSFGLNPQPIQINPLAGGQSVTVSIPVGISTQSFSQGPLAGFIQMAVKNNTGLFYFQMNVPFYILFSENAQLEREDYVSSWKSIQQENFKEISPIFSVDIDSIQRRLQSYNLFYVARRNVNQQDFLYFNARYNDDIILLELAIGSNACKACVKAKNLDLIPLFEQALVAILSK